MKPIFTILLLMMATPIIAQQNTVAGFSHMLHTSAAREEIWQLWTDVPGWKNWDTELKDAQLQVTFCKGARGTLSPVNGPKSSFEITEVVPQSEIMVSKQEWSFGQMYIPRMEIKLKYDTLDNHVTEY